MCHETEKRDKSQEVQTIKRIAEDLLLTYRGNRPAAGRGSTSNTEPRSPGPGSQGGRHLGPPYPEVVEGVTLHKLPGLDLYNPDHLFRPARYRDLLSPVNTMEFLDMCLGGFPEPRTFGTRVHRWFCDRKPAYDVIHDNQCLSWGILDLEKLGYPTVATIHHPITVDRDTEIDAAPNILKRLKVRRWYTFLDMQIKVSGCSHGSSPFPSVRRGTSAFLRCAGRQVPGGAQRHQHGLFLPANGNGRPETRSS